MPKPKKEADLAAEPDVAAEAPPEPSVGLSVPATVGRDDLAARILEDARARLGGFWDQLKDNEAAMAEQAANDLAALQLLGMAGADIEAEAKVVTATLANLAAAGRQRVVSALHDALGSVVQEPLTVAVGIVGQVLRG